MEINLLKDKENIYFVVDGEKQLMNFENLVILSEKVIKNIENFHYQINCDDTSLELYKVTLDELIKSLLDDKELLDLLIQNNNSIEQEEPQVDVMIAE